MNIPAYILLLIFSVFMMNGQRHTAPPTKAQARDTVRTGIRGQVVSIGSPAVRENWTPPPLKRVSTLVVLDDDQKPIREVKTDALGRFTISLPPGEYYLLVKESFIPKPKGPFTVRRGKVVAVEAVFDNGMR